MEWQRTATLARVAFADYISIETAKDDSRADSREETEKPGAGLLFIPISAAVSLYSDSKNCPNVWHFLIVCDIASHSDQTKPKC